jgi:hypothetical protein
MAKQYNFLTPWRFDNASITEVADILEDTASLPQWWPDLFKSVTIKQPGGIHALGKVAYCECRARLPYTLRFTYTVVEQRYPYGSTLTSSGDLIGTGIWRLSERGSGVDVEYEWRVRLEKPFLRVISPLVRSFLAANHEWSMQRGQEGLRREIVRRRALTKPVTG